MSRSPFTLVAAETLQDRVLRENLRNATATIRGRRARAVAEVSGWESLREQAAAVKDAVLDDLPSMLLAFEAAATRAGAVVHWARTAEEANNAVVGVARRHGVQEVVKVKSMTTAEIGLNEALARAGIAALESDLAELIVQLAGERPSHIVVPSVHKNRRQIRELFEQHLGLDSQSDEPAELADAARRFLRRRFLEARLAVCGANFAIAETGSICLVESEGNGRMCTTLPPVLVAVVGIEKLLPRFEDLAVFLQLLARSATGERLSPYTSIWTGTRAADGPRELHVVLVDAGRTRVLADPVGRDVLRCIRCSACLNVCPVYTRTGADPYDAIYPGPIGAVLVPQLRGSKPDRELPWASTLCGACYDVCPVRIDIPRILVHLRARRVERLGVAAPGERLAMRALARLLASPRLLAGGQALLRVTPPGAHRILPGLRSWARSREAPSATEPSFRRWWARHHGR